MKLTVLLLTVAFLHVNANGYSQTITYSGKNVPLEKIFTVIKEQAGFGFIYFDEQLKGAKKVTINVKNAAVENVLAICMKDQPYDYTIKAKTIFIINRQKKETADLKVTTEQQKGKRINISGRVTGEQGEPVVGATITVKGTDVATSTNEKGVFYLNDVDEDAVLVVTYISYQAQEVALKGRNSLDVRLKIGGSDLDEAMVVAYNTTTRRMNTGAVSVVKGEQIATLPNRSFDKSLQGLVPGLLVTGGSGLPGGGVSNFVIRGIATAVDPSLGSTVRNPLIVIDGVPVTQDHFQINFENIKAPPFSNPLAQLNTSDIETITVLKDAAAIALYGSRASNGVIVVKTRRGRTGKAVFSFRHQTDISSRYMGKQNVLTQDEYMELLLESHRNLNSPAYPNDEAILTDLRKKFPVIVKAPGDTSFYPATDWFGELFRNNATTVSNEFSISGGTEKTNYYLNFEYTKENGVTKATGYDRKSLRLNFENRPADWIKLGLNTTLSYNVQDYGTGSRAYVGSVASNMSPLNPARYSDGSMVLNYLVGAGPQVASLFPNPLAAAEYNTNRNTATRSLNTLNGEINFLKHFQFNTIAGFDFMLAEAKEKADPRLVDPGNFSDPGIGRIEEQTIRRANLVSTNIIRYNNSFNRIHTINLLAGQEAQIQSQKLMLMAVQNLSSPYYDQINSPGVNLLRYNAVNSRETLLSFFAQVNYGLMNKYFLSGSVRRDGSSRFGEDKRFGTYWSTGLGWIVSNESFLRRSSSWLNHLKLRGSIGAAGNAGAVTAATQFDRLQYNRFLGGVGVYPTQTPGNPNVRWEQTFSWDAGLELRLWNDRINITTDVYERNTKDLIFQTNLPQTTGYYEALTNIGKIRNNGIEASLSFNIIKKKDLNWYIDANWSTNKNRLVKSNVPTASLVYSYLGNAEGKNFNSFFMPVWAGVNPADGSAQWYDSTGTAVTSYPWAFGNSKFVGKPQPDGFGSLSTRVMYKSLELSLQFYYQYGYQIYIQDDMVNDGRNPYMNQDKRALDRWRKPGDIAVNPKRVLNNSNGSAFERISTRYLFDGDHIRLQNATLAYNFPNSITNTLKLTRIRVYIQGNNLALWTKFPGQDPDRTVTSGSTGMNVFPSQRAYSFGLNVNF